MKRCIATIFFIGFCLSLYGNPPFRKQARGTWWPWRNSRVAWFCYGGIYPIGLALPDDLKDYGYQFGAGNRLLGLEFSYWKLGKRYDILLDLRMQDREYYSDEFGDPRWSGEKWNIGITYYPGGHNPTAMNWNNYLIYEQESRTYEPLFSMVRTDEIGAVVDSSAIFHPHQKSYNLFYGVTLELHWTILYVRGGFGLGLGVRQFSFEGEYPRGSYYFENKLLEHRRPTRISALYRANLSVGIVFRTKRKK